jgi:hypothetical protein
MALKRVLAVLVCGLLAAGCTLHRNIERSALDYNRTADRVDKEILLLNVARARRGEGLTFTGITELRGSYSVKTDGTLEVPFGGGSDVNLLGSGVAYQTNPSVKVVPLATKEFQQGISSDIDASIFYLLWERGWPREVLLHLFIEKIVVSTEDGAPVGAPCLFDDGAPWRTHANPDRGHICEFVNDPDDPGRFRAFQRFLRVARMRPFLYTEPGERIGPVVAARDLELLDIVSGAHDGTLRLRQKENKDAYYLESTAEEGMRFSLSRQLSRRLPREPGADGPAPRRVDASVPDTGRHDPLTRDGIAGKTRVDIHLRSAEGLIYYLGEIFRATVGADAIDRRRLTYQRIYGDAADACADEERYLVGDRERLATDPCLVPLFVAWVGEGDAEVAVDTREGRVFVPAGREGDRYIAGQSLLVMALIRALFHLNTSLDDLPTTETVITTGISP